MIILTEKQIALGWQISTAHEWIQLLPLTEKTVQCVACSLKTKIGDFDVRRCKQHVVGAGSGFFVQVNDENI